MSLHAPTADLTGKIALVTGATGGLGLRVATVLASQGARVLVGYRNEARGRAALEQIAVSASAAPELVELDVSSIASVAHAVAEVRARTSNRLDILVNNAGVMAPPRSFSTDGWELQWATNVIGPTALTWQLLPAIEAAPAGRVVFVSSETQRRARLDEQRIRADIRADVYRGFPYYGRTKLADLLLSQELDQHFRAVGSSALSLAAHPGFSATSIVDNGFAGLPRFAHRIAASAVGVLGQPVEAGALPILFAATAPDARGGQLIGPTGPFELRGRPGVLQVPAPGRDRRLAASLTRVLSELIGMPAPKV
jgi:NAD(P)-dependent dehydrogenase (short-subunit alcohol dehydrogenase family)